VQKFVEHFFKQQTYYDEYESFCFQNFVRQIMEYFCVDNAEFYINTSLSIVLKLDGKFNFKI